MDMMPQMMMMNPMQQAMAKCMNRIADRMLPTEPQRYTQRERRAFHEEMEQYFRDLRDGKCEVPDAMAEAMCLAALEAYNKYMAEHPAAAAGEREQKTQHTSDAAKHKKFKEIIELLREETSLQKRNEIMRAHFDELTQTEEELLHELAKDQSKASHARNMRMNVERFAEIKHEIERKIK